MVEVINAIQELNKEQLEAIEFEVRVALMEMEVANE